MQFLIIYFLLKNTILTFLQKNNITIGLIVFKQNFYKISK